jgi:5-methyltetrahydropteroyltriglutamate--homocysteine methyltransferase
VYLLTTTVVGSYPQPDWLIDRESLSSRLPPRVRAREIWRVEEPFLEQAQDDATLLAIRDMERAGVDIISDGEMRRESYSNRFATALGGMDLDNPGVAMDRTGHPNPVPRVVGPIIRTRPIEVSDVEFLRRNTERPIKMTAPGPFTVTQQAQNDYYPDDKALALDLALAINAELKDLKAAGADVVQLDEPYLQARPDKAKAYGVEAINRALEGVEGPTALHMCFGYAAVVRDKPGQYAFLGELNDCIVQQVSIEAAQPRLELSALRDLRDKTIILGVLDLGDDQVETAEEVAGRIRAALGHVPPERLIPAPDCGMKYLPRDVAFGKLRALVDGAAIVRAELK